MAQTPMEIAITLLEQKKKSLQEMDLLGILLENELIHKSNEISGIQIMLSNMLPEERQNILDAYNHGYRDGDRGTGIDKRDIAKFDDANNYFINKFKK